jgi:hypothetical protein
VKILDYFKEIWSVVTGDLEDIYLFEQLTRKASDKENYIRWLQTREKEQLLNYIFQEYRLSKLEKEDRNMIRFFKGRANMGFVLRYPETMLPLHFQHLFDLLKEKTENYGYFITTSDRKIFNHKPYEETIERYQLQSTRFNEAADLNSQKLSGIFNNIWLELFKVDNQPMYMKFICRNLNEKASQSLTFTKLLGYVCNQADFMEEEAIHLHSSESDSLS